MSKTVLVTGGAGFIGSHLVERLVGEGYSVRVADNFTTGHIENLKAVRDKIEVVPENLWNFDGAITACKDVEYVLHHAAIPSVSESITAPFANQKNGEITTLNVLQACVVNKVRRVVFASSASVYGEQITMPIKESVLLSPKSPYAASKMAGEAYMSAFSNALHTVSLRYFNVFGKRQDPKSPYSGVISVFKDKILRGEQITIFGSGRQTRDFVHVDNIVEANMLAMKTKWDGVFNIGCGRATSINKLITTMGSILHRKVNVVNEKARPGDIKHSEANIFLAETCLEYTPVMHLKEGLKKYLNE